ncbi:MAG: gluconate 2-dehydrogenase subunit 3 family protein, partial [Gemmatimonadota bacterium]
MTGSEGDRGARTGRDDGRGISRREALRWIGGGALGLGAGYALPSPVLASFLRRLEQGYEWAFLRPGEVETMTTLADMVIPADERSGSASDAATVEYVDFVLSISDDREQVEWHEGLRWLDLQAARRRGDEPPGEGRGASAEPARSD